MNVEDARGYADDLTDPQRAVVLIATAEKPSRFDTIARGSGYEQSDISQAIEQLLSMNLIEKEQSRLAGKFFYNYVLLNDRGVQVQAILRDREDAK